MLNVFGFDAKLEADGGVKAENLSWTFSAYQDDFHDVAEGEPHQDAKGKQTR